MAIPTITVTPQNAAQAYRAASQGTSTAAGAGSFGDVLSNALKSVVDTSRTAETQSKLAISGAGNLTDVATAVAKAELTLQTTVALRDRVVQAYQDIMRMPI
jgi:flagellar hook-basal body complex protein FliE